MAIEGDGFDVLGVSIGDRSPVDRLVHLSLDAGVTALYGLNGAGKTSILRLVLSALTGQLPLEQSSATADVHVRLHDPGAAPEAYTWIESLRIVLGEALDRQRGFLRRFAVELDPAEYGLDEDETGAWNEYEELGARSIGADVWSHLAALIDAGGIAATGGTTRSPLSPEVREALYEGADAGLLTLRATGKPGEPSWDVLLPLLPTSSAGSSMLSRAYTSWSEFREIAAEQDGVADRLSEWMRQPSRLNVLVHGENAMPYLHDLKTGPQELPGWLGVPFLNVGTSLLSKPVHVLDHESAVGTDIGVRHLQELAFPDLHRDDWEASVVAGTDGFALNSDLEQRTREAEQTATRVLDAVLLDAPVLRFNWRTPEDWLVGDIPRWEFRDEFTKAWLPTSALSEARLRWTQDAIRIATAGSDLPTVLISDEPERGLHRLAERRLSMGLGRMAREHGLSVLAASHSPALLDATWVRPHLVGRTSQGFVTVREVPLTLKDDVSSELSALQLGLSFSDLAAMMKLALIVEGLHDEWVIGSCLRPTLDDSLTQVHPMHGAKRAQSLADARFLFSGTDGPLLVVLDNLHDHAADLWEEAVLEYGSSREKALRVLAPLLEDRKRYGDEYLFLHQLAVRAVETGRIDRIHIFGLSQPDIICYLPPTHVLIDCDESWDSLLDRWRASFDGAVASNLKKWLANQGLLPQDPKELDARVRQAAELQIGDTVTLHQDLVSLALRIRELSSIKRDA